MHLISMTVVLLMMACVDDRPSMQSHEELVTGCSAHPAAEGCPSGRDRYAGDDDVDDDDDDDIDDGDVILFGNAGAAAVVAAFAAVADWMWFSCLWRLWTPAATCRSQS